MDKLRCDTLFLLVSGDLGEDGRGGHRYIRFSRAAPRSLQGDRHGMESVIDIVESLIGMCWNQQTRPRYNQTH